MAEAIKPSTSKQKQKLNQAITNDQDNDQQNSIKISTHSPVTDQSLEKRLNSLKSFINNIEPSAPQVEKPKEKENLNEIKINTLPAVALPVTANSSLKESEPLKPSKLVENEAIKVNSHQIYPTAPVLVSSQQQQQQQIQQQQQEKIINIPPLIVSPVTTSASSTSTIDYNLDKIKSVNKLNYPKLAWNRQISASREAKHMETNEIIGQSTFLNESNRLEPETLEKNLLIDSELVKFFERDLMCKELDVYYKCKLIQYEQFDQFLDEFIKNHSTLNEFIYNSNDSVSSSSRHEFFKLVKDYYEARLLVKKCIHHMNQFKWECLTNQMRIIWAFEKYTIEASGICGDQQRVKHELTSNCIEIFVYIKKTYG